MVAMAAGRPAAPGPAAAGLNPALLAAAGLVAATGLPAASVNAAALLGRGLGAPLRGAAAAGAPLRGAAAAGAPLRSAAAAGAVGAPDAMPLPGEMRALRVVCCYHVANA
jgi:hypothetical protein